MDSRADPRARQCFDIFRLCSSSEDSVLTAMAKVQVRYNYERGNNASCPVVNDARIKRYGIDVIGAGPGGRRFKSFRPDQPFRTSDLLHTKIGCTPGMKPSVLISYPLDASALSLLSSWLSNTRFALLGVRFSGNQVQDRSSWNKNQIPKSCGLSTSVALFDRLRRCPNQNLAGGLKVRQAELGGVMAW